MRQSSFLLVVLLCTAGPAFAQVTIDLHALDALPGAKPAHRAPRPASRPQATAKPKPPPAATQQQDTAKAATPAAPAATTTATALPAPATTPAPQAAAPPPALPSAPPPTIALAPVAPPLPSTPAAPPPPPPISDTAASTASATGNGLLVTFGAGQVDLSQTSAGAIEALVRNAPPGDSTTFNVVAYAAGTPEDASTARRLSLSRALAVRSALIALGVNSSRIYVRALGAATGDGPPDRVDLTVLGANAPAATPAAAPAPPAPPPPPSRPQ